MVAKAILQGLYGFERTIEVPYPPPPQWLVPIEQPVRLNLDAPESEPVPLRHRVFRLQTSLRDSYCPWMKDGRTEPAYVYMEFWS